MKTQWTEQLIETEAKKYNSTREFKEGNYAAYRAALNLKILPKACKHMRLNYRKTSGNQIALTPENILAEAKKYSTKWEFKIKAPGAFQKSNELKIMDQCFQNTFGQNKPKTRWSHETVKSEALKYSTLNDFELHAVGAFKYAKRHKILEFITSHMPKRFKPSDPYQKLRKIAMLFKRCALKKDFQIQYKTEYSFLKRHKKLNILKNIIPTNNTAPDYWSRSEIFFVASLCKTRKEFSSDFRPAAQKARQLGIYEECCSHMEMIIDQRELKLQQEIEASLSNLLSNYGLEYKIADQKSLTIQNKRIVLDLVLTINNLHYPIEVKHDKSSWNISAIEQQVSKYNKLLGTLENYKPVTVVSRNGKYGLSLKEFLETFSNHFNLIV